MNRTGIEWARNPDGAQGYTCNPITGCRNHANGICRGGGFPCYAYRLAHGRLKKRYIANRHVAMELKDGYVPMELVCNDPFVPRFWWKLLGDIVFNLGKKPKGIFVCDMSDLFGIGVPDDWTFKILTAMRQPQNRQHRFYLLTKQPQNLAKWSPFPDNCWVGVTATNIPMLIEASKHLAEVNAKLKYISLEPLLIYDGWPSLLHGLFRHANIDWLIVGAQTKPYKPPKIEWIQEIVEAADKAEISVFLKDNLKPILPCAPAYAWAYQLVNYRATLRQEMPMLWDEEAVKTIE